LENPKQTLTEYIKAGFSSFYIYTEDEWSVIQDLKEISSEFKFHEEDSDWDLKQWTVEGGDMSDFLNAITENGIYTLLNPHFFLEEPGVIQVIKTKAPIWKAKGIYVFLICNAKKIPDEINRDLTYLEYPLPDENKIFAKLQFVLDSVKDDLPEIKVPETINDGSSRAAVNAALGLTSSQAENAFSLSLVRERQINPQIVTQVKADEYLKTGILELEFPQPIESFKGYQNLMGYIYQMVGSFNGSDRYNLPPPKGILLVGVPGVGKTLASKAVASIFQLMLVKVDFGKMFGSLVGQSESKTDMVIQILERMAPVVGRIDEIEKQMSGMGGNTDGGTTDRVMGKWLTWLQERKRPVFIIATANNINNLRPELMRKGRFDEIFFMDLPNDEERPDIFRYHISKRIDLSKFKGVEKNIKVFSKMSDGFSGSEIEQITIDSFRKVQFRNETDTIIPTIEETIQETSPLSVIRKEDIDKIRQWAVDNNARLASSNPKIEKEQTNKRKIMV